MSVTSPDVVWSKTFEVGDAKYLAYVKQGPAGYYAFVDSSRVSSQVPTLNAAMGEAFREVSRRMRIMADRLRELGNLHSTKARLVDAAGVRLARGD